MFILTVSEKGGQPSSYEFDKSEISIGRMKGNDIVLPKGNVSKRHSQIVLDETFSIRDLGSTNGTFVNGRRIQGDHIISDDDKIYIGDFILQLDTSVNAVPPSPPSRPPSDFSSTPPGPSAFQPNFSDSKSQTTGMKKTLTASTFTATPDMTTPGSMSPSFSPPPPPNPGPLAPNNPLSGSGMHPILKNNSTPPKGATDPSSSPSSPVIPSPGPAPTDLPPPEDQDPLTLNAGEFSSVSSISLVYDSSAVDASLDLPAYPQSIPVFVDPLEDNFDEAFHTAQTELYTALSKNIKNLPKKYPPQKSDITKYTEIVKKEIGALKTDVDKAKLESLLIAECIGLGPIEALLDDPEVIEIFVHRYDQVFIRKSGNLIRHQSCFSAPEFLEVAALRLLGKTDGGLVQNVRFEDGTKVAVSLPPLTENPVLTLQKPRSIKATLTELVASQAASDSTAVFLQNAVIAGRSILIAGPHKSGRTTFLSALAGELPKGERIAVIEDAPNIAFPEYAIRFEENAEHKSIAISAALQTHPNRILLDPCSPTNGFQWINAIASGTTGSMGTIFGTTATDALGRLESMCILGQDTLNLRGIREQISRAVDLVVVLNRSPKGFRVQQISEVTGVDFDSYRVHDIFYYQAHELNDGTLHPTGYIPTFYEDLKHSGFEVDFNIFRE